MSVHSYVDILCLSGSGLHNNIRDEAPLLPGKQLHPYSYNLVHLVL